MPTIANWVAFGRFTAWVAVTGVLIAMVLSGQATEVAWAFDA